MNPSQPAKMNEKITLQVMRLLEENPDMTQRELALALGVSVGGVNYCLNALMEKGWVKMKNFAQSKNKFGYIYVLTPRGVGERAELTQRFLARKMAEYEALRDEIERLRGELRPEPGPGPELAGVIGVTKAAKAQSVRALRGSEVGEGSQQGQRDQRDQRDQKAQRDQRGQKDQANQKDLADPARTPASLSPMGAVTGVKG